MPKQLTPAMILTLSFAIACAGCSSRSSVSVPKGTTVGQELTDLDKARDQGLLTEQEYHAQREAILKRK